MRKIFTISEIDPNTFQPKLTIKQKHDDGSITTIFSETMQYTPPPKYTKEEQEKIDLTNTILTSKGMEELSEKEIEYMLDPSGINKRLKQLEKDISNDSEKLQQLAGFKVEKKIIPLP